MSKQLEIKEVLSQLAASKHIQFLLTETRINEIATLLSSLPYATRDIVKSKIIAGRIEFKEAIDFSDTNYWIDRIVEIINNS
jgi:hypothetical protein